MHLWYVRSLLLASVMGILSAGLVDAASPGGNTANFSGGGNTVITTITLTAPLFLDESNTPAGTAVYKIVEVQKGTNPPKVCVSLSVHVYGLPVPNGTIVTLDLENPDENPFGSAKVCHGRASFCLDSCRGDIIPEIEPGDELEVESANVDDDLAVGTFGPPVITVVTH